MKKILLYFAGNINDPKGTPNRVRTVAEILHATGYEIFFAGKTRPTFVDDAHFLALPRPLARFNFLRAEIKKNKIDIVYFQTSAHITLLALLARVTGVPCGCDFHGLLHEEEKYYGTISAARYFFDKWIDYAAAAQLQFATGVCGSLKRYYAAVLPRFEILSAVADEVFFDSSGKISQEVTEWKQHRVVVGYAGNAKDYQGIDVLIDAMKIVQQQRPGVFGLVLVVSSGYDGVKQLVDAAGLTQDTLLLGQQPHDAMPGILRSCDILTIPRRSAAITEYAFPSKIAEYAALGKPLVVTEVGDMSFFITDGVNGFVAPPENPSIYAKALVKLEDNGLRSQIGARIQQTAREQFHPDAFKKIFIRFFESLTS